MITLSSLPPELSTGGSTEGATEESSISSFAIFATVAEAILMILIFVNNGTVLVAFVRTPKLHTITNYYIIQMAMADFSVGVWMPMHIVMFVYPRMLDSMTLCTLRYASLMLSLAASILSLLAMTYDRLSSILYPLHYHSTMTLRRYLSVALLVWVIPVSLGFLASFWHNEWEDMPVRECDLVLVLTDYLRFIIVPIFLLTSLIMIAMYIVIFRVAAVQARKEHAHTSSSSSSSSAVPHASSHIQTEMKMIKTGLIIFCVFYSCWMPLFSLIFIQVCYEPLQTNATVAWLRAVAVMPAVLNSALNPMVYAFRMPLYKAYFLKLLPCLTRKTGAAQVDATHSLPTDMSMTG